MFKSIFQKLLVIFISILILSFSVTGVMLYFFLDNFVSKEKVSLLQQSAEGINRYLDEFVENQSNPIMILSFKQILQTYSNYTNSIIMVIDTEGNIVFSDPDINQIQVRKDYQMILKNLNSNAGNYSLPNEQQYKKVISGQDVKEIGDFYGLFKDTGESWLTIGKTFRHIDTDGRETIMGAVLLYTPMPEIQKARSSVFGFFLISVGVAVGISIILVYVFSLRITKPLKEIKNAAREISGGQFQKRLTIKSKDEIGELAISFNNMVTALENLEQMRRDFVANVSHELRTPMTSIRGFIEGILDGTIPPERQKTYLTIVKEETSRLSRLVNDLLDLAKIESGELQLTIRTMNINELVRRCIIKLESLIVEKNIMIEADFEVDELYAKADPDAIERVIINLIHNAVKFTPEMGKLYIRTATQKGKVLVTIQDTGIGIDSHELSSIWDRFYKSDKSRGKDKTGTGLGLAIVKNIILEHKQDIWVESELGKGTAFYFTLDRAPENEE